jgi:hypothetical protein
VKFFKKFYTQWLQYIEYPEDQKTKQKYRNMPAPEKQKTQWHGDKFVKNSAGWVPLPNDTFNRRAGVNSKHHHSSANH